MRKYSFLYFIPALLLGIISCQRDDDEPPAREIKAISRLYISTSDYQAGAATALENVWVVNAADSSTFPDADELDSYESSAKGGRAIHFSALRSGLIFQSSLNSPGTNDTAIHVMSVNNRGDISTVARIANRRYDNVRGLYYTVVTKGNVSDDFLLALNKSNREENGNLFIFNRPKNSGNFRVPTFRIPLNFIPWGILVDDSNVLIVKTGNEGGIIGYEGLTESFMDTKDSLMNVSPSYALTIPGSRNLRGISYSKAKDILVMTDYDVNNNVIENGRILIFENFSSNSSSTTITPTRIIQGGSTGLRQPMDVAIDPREDGKYIYVADPGEGAKKVFRYLITDEGNIAPNAALNIHGRAPESISLDAR